MTPIDTEKPLLNVAEDRVPGQLNATDADQQADEYQRRIKEQQKRQFQILKDEARALFGMLDGRPGVRSPADLQKLLEKAGDEIGNGRFIVRCLGAERYLDAGTVAALITLRQNLIAGIRRPTAAADMMIIDTALIAYYNFLRVQGWIGNLSLIFERELFGQAALNEIHGPELGDRLREQLERLSEVILPLQDRAHRMMIRSLAQLPTAVPPKAPSQSSLIPAGP
jgi:hypothetical protein